MPYKVSNLNGTFQQQYEADPRIVAALAARQEADKVPIYSPGQGVARALSKMLDAYTQKQIQGEYQQKQTDQNNALADALAPPTDNPGLQAPPVQLPTTSTPVDNGALGQSNIQSGGGQIDASVPDYQTENPNRSKISALLNSGLISGGSPSVATALMKSAGLGEPDAPIKGQPGDTFLDPHTYKPITSIPQKNDPNKPFNADGTPNTAYQQYEAGSKPPPMRTIQRGTLSVDQQYDQGSKTWKDISSGPKFKPDAPTDNYSAPTMIGFTGPDGEDVQKAAIYNKKTGQYTDASTMQPIVNPPNLRVIGNATGGGRSMAMAGRVSTAALDAASDIENLSGIGTGAGMGLFANAETTPLSALSRTLTPQEVQDTQTTMAGLSRAMSLLGSGGMQGSDEVMKSFDRLQPNTGDSMLTTMRKLGSFRQQATNGIDAALASPMYSPQQKAQLKEAKSRLEKAVPWTPHDVQTLENNGKSGLSMHDVYAAKLKPAKTKTGATVSNWPGAK